MGNSISLEEELINLRMVSKQMQRSSKKCEKNEKAAVDKLKKVSFFARDALCCNVCDWV
jgi:charged multivesicular body protein 1